MDNVKLLLKTQIKEEKIIFFPKSKWIPEIMKRYQISEKQVECIYDNGDVENEVLLINEKTIPIYHYDESVDLGTGKALIICSHHWPIIKQLAERKDFNSISVYISLNEWLLSLDEAQKQKIAQERIDHIDGIVYGLVKKYCNKKDEYVKEKILDIGKHRMIVSAVQLVLTTHCTLNCKECFAGKPYRGGVYSHFPLEKVLKNINSFLEVIDECIELELIGGEVFLYPELKQVIEYCIQQDKVQMVQLTSNGTIFPGPEVLEVLKNDKVVVGVSEYKGVDYLRFEKRLKEENINCYGIDARWVCMPDYDKEKKQYKSYDYNEDELELAYFNCNNCYSCYAIYENRVYICYRTAMLASTGCYDFSSEEYADLDLPFDERKRNVQKIIHARSTQGCNYCGMGDFYNFKNDGIEPGVQI